MKTIEVALHWFIVICFAFCLFYIVLAGMTNEFAQPGSKVSILWGLVEYEKEATNSP